MTRFWRLLALMLLTAALLCVTATALAEHTYHYAYCTTPNVCAEGGEPYSGDWLIHGWIDYAYSGDVHWEVCTDCGTIISEPEAHVPTCLGVCLYCLVPTPGSSGDHLWMLDSYYVNEDFHWYACLLCEREVLEHHYRSCAYGQECFDCGAEFPSWQEYTYHFDTYYVSDEFQHWLVCWDCGETAYSEPHTPSAANPKVCGACGMPLNLHEVSVEPAALTGSFVAGAPITATMNAKNAYAYNYWLYDSTGTIVQSKTNTTDTSWTFTVSTPGAYLVRTYATDFSTDGSADTAWFYVDGKSVTVSNVGVSGSFKAGAPLTGTASVEAGFAFNYWLFNDQGTIVQEHTNTTDTSWTFSVSTPGLYLLRVYATDFKTDAYADSAWFYVADPVVVASASLSQENLTVGGTMTVTPHVSGGSGLYAYNYWVYNSSGQIVMEKTNTLDVSATFTFTEPGAYLIRVYATDFVTDDHADSAWFAVVR